MACFYNTSEREIDVRSLGQVYAQSVALGDELYFLYQGQGGCRGQLKGLEVCRQIRDRVDGLLTKTLEPLSSNISIE